MHSPQLVQAIISMCWRDVYILLLGLLWSGRLARAVVIPAAGACMNLEYGIREMTSDASKPWKRY